MNYSIKLLSFLTLGLTSSILSNAKEHTNFIVILMDDMGYGDIESNGATGYETPNINALQS